MSSVYGPTPRVNSSHLASHSGQTIRMTAKVVRMDGDTALLEASDKGQVRVHLHREANIADKFIELIGKVNDDLSIKMFSSMNMGDNLDLDVHEKIVQLYHSQKGEGVYK